MLYNVVGERFIANQYTGASAYWNKTLKWSSDTISLIRANFAGALFVPEPQGL
jgi:hypothetical protein